MEINETIELIENIEKQTNEEVDSEDKIFLEIFKNTLKTGISLCNGIKEGKYDDNDAIEIATCNITNANIQYFIEGKNSEFPYICNIFRLIDSFIHALIDLETEYSNKDIITFLINVFKQVRYVDFDRVSLDYITILYTYFRKIIDIYSSNFINDLNNLCEGNFKKVIKWTDKYELILRNRFGDELIVSYKENKLDVDLFLSHIVDKEIITDEVEFWKDEINRILDNLKYDGKLYSYEYEIKKVMGNYGTNTGKC